LLQITIVGIGKIREKYIQEGMKEYLKRLSKYVRLKIIETEDEPCPDKASDAEKDRIRQKEGERLLKKIPRQGYVILLDLDGKDLSSEELAVLLEEKALEGQNKITFVIGGSLGVSEEIRQKADFRWSFSRLTFTHQLIRLLLLEQIFRACKINKGEIYHK
jgi:23S rRNA (pseudouridine1915-N3)-methyltransferase